MRGLCIVMRKPSAADAIRFDGSPEMAQQILDWLEESLALPRGHFRANLGRVQGTVFLPGYSATDPVLRADPGDWIVIGEDGMSMSVLDAADFAAHFEVVP